VEFKAETAFKRKLPFVETDVLQNVLLTLNFIDVVALVVEEALARVEASKAAYSRMMIESSEPGLGSSGFEFRNVKRPVELSIHSLEVECYCRCLLPFFPWCRNGLSKSMGCLFLDLKWLLTKM